MMMMMVIRMEEGCCLARFYSRPLDQIGQDYDVNNVIANIDSSIQSLPWFLWRTKYLAVG